MQFFHGPKNAKLVCVSLIFFGGPMAAIFSWWTNDCSFSLVALEFLINAQCIMLLAGSSAVACWNIDMGQIRYGNMSGSSFGQHGSTKIHQARNLLSRSFRTYEKHMLDTCQCHVYMLLMLMFLRTPNNPLGPCQIWSSTHLAAWCLAEHSNY